MHSTTSLIASLCCSNAFLYVWIASIGVYMLTSVITERWQSARKKQPALHDRSFEWIPRNNSLVYVTDGIGCVGAVYLIMWNFGSDPTASLAVKQALCFSAIGYVVSASLHSVTLLPGTDHAPGVPVFGGDVDKLMSNHTFHFGLFLRILVIIEKIPSNWLVPWVLFYSIMLAATRGHYAVDIVLAWWGIVLVFAWVGMDLPDTSTCAALW